MSRLSPAAIILGAALCFSACATGKVNIPPDLSPSVIIQQAQEAADRNRFNVALQYYQALLERYPANIDLVCTAEYAIAFIHYKQKDYPLAREGLNSLLERYDFPGEEYLPPHFKVLAAKVLEQIDAKEKR